MNPYLTSTDKDLYIIKERKRNDVVIGVPHHARAGIGALPCKAHPDSDENAGHLGWHLAESLECHSIIVCNSTQDANKLRGSRYATQIAAWQPKVLIEIHGHAERDTRGKGARFDVEISSGSKTNNIHSTKLATCLATEFAAVPELRSFSISGDFDEIHFKATGSVTITDERWIAYHIELPPRLRRSSHAKDGPPPELGYTFCNILAKHINALHQRS